jgi:hypothetical protein
VITKRSEECNTESSIRQRITESVTNHDKEVKEGIPPPSGRIPWNMTKEKIRDCEANDRRKEN